MRRVALTAAGLLAVVTLAVAGARVATAGTTPTAHTCSVTDKKFISVAQSAMTSVGLLGSEYLKGGADPADVIGEAARSARRINGTAPRDPSLQQTRLLMEGMFSEYGRAIKARGKNATAGKHMYRSYSLANFAHEELLEAAPALKKAGCDVYPLL